MPSAALAEPARLMQAPVAADPEAQLLALVRRVRDQDDLYAFDQIYRLTRADVAKTLVHLVGRRPDLEDLIQETYLRLLKAVKGFREEARFKTFLFRICANVAYMQLRWWRRRPEESVSDVPEQVASDDPERDAQRAQARALVQQALAVLKPKKRVVFVYHELMGMGPEEIALAVDTSPNTVRSRLHHARLEFHAELQRLLAVRATGGGDGLR